MFGLGIDADGIPDELHIHSYPTVIDFLVEVILIPDELWDRILGQPVLYCEFHFNIALVIGLEGFPFLPVMLRQVSCAAAVGLGGFARHTEIADEVFSLFHFLVIQLQHCTDAFQGEWKPHICSPDAGAFPG